MGARLIYKNAPLIELIVEIQWEVPHSQKLPAGASIVTDSSSAFDLWLHELTAALRTQGFNRLERLVPHEVPVFVHQPVFRIRSDDPFPIYQFGHGIFTVNAGPPNYTSWDNFRPQVEKGLHALINRKPVEADLNEFSVVSLRYIDVFGEELRSGASNFIFMRDVLGVTVSMPEELLGKAKSEALITPACSVRFPLENEEGTSLAFSLSAGRFGNSIKNDTIMDTIFSAACPLPASSVDKALQVLDSGHDLIHKWFTILTSKLHEQMIPTPEAD